MDSSVHHIRKQDAVGVRIYLDQLITLDEFVQWVKKIFKRDKYELLHVFTNDDLKFDQGK